MTGWYSKICGNSIILYVKYVSTEKKKRYMRIIQSCPCACDIKSGKLWNGRITEKAISAKLGLAREKVLLSASVTRHGSCLQQGFLKDLLLSVFSSKIGSKESHCFIEILEHLSCFLVYSVPLTRTKQGEGSCLPCFCGIHRTWKTAWHRGGPCKYWFEWMDGWTKNRHGPIRVLEGY